MPALVRNPRLEGIEVDWDMGVSIAIDALGALERAAGTSTESSGMRVDSLGCSVSGAAVV